MNKLLPNGNLLAVYGVGDDNVMSSLVKEVPPSDPEYEGSTLLLSLEDAEEALAVLAKYRREHHVVS